jgi:hypothetical protein
MKKVFWWILPFIIIMPLGYYYLTFIKQTGYFHDSLITEFSVKKLNNILKELELQKIKYGKYPDTLQEIKEALEKEADPFSFPLYDPTLIKCANSNQEYYYKKIDNDHYYLLGLGCDLTPFTNDDLLPTIETQNFGLKIHKKI